MDDDNNKSQREFKRIKILGIIDYWELGKKTAPKSEHLDRYFINSKYSNYFNLANKLDFSKHDEKTSENTFLKDRFYGLFQAMHPKIFDSASEIVISRKAIAFHSSSIIDVKSNIWCMLILNDEIIPVYIKCQLFKTVPIYDEAKFNFSNKYILITDDKWCKRALNYFDNQNI